MIRWEREGNDDWRGYSGEVPVATVSKDTEAERERWAWKLRGIKRPKGWRRPVGHRTAWLDARRAAESYWGKWLSAAGLEPDLAQLARQSLPPEERPRRRRRQAKEPTPAATTTRSRRPRSDPGETPGKKRASQSRPRRRG